MTLLQLVQEFCVRTGITKPSYIVGNTDPQVMQLLGLLNEVLEDVVGRWSWTELVREATFTTVAQEDQGAVKTLAPFGYKWILNDTITNRTLRLPVYGPISPEKWQAFKALPNAGPFYKYRIRGGRLLFNPQAAAGHTCAFEYQSSYSILDTDGVTYKKYPAADTDTFVLDEDWIQAGLRWKWRSEKGLDYAEEFNRYETMLNDAKGRDGTKPQLDMAGGSHNFTPGIFVPSGNWNLP